MLKIFHPCVGEAPAGFSSTLTLAHRKALHAGSTPSALLPGAERTRWRRAPHGSPQDWPSSLPPPAAASGSRPDGTPRTVRTVGGVFWEPSREAVAKKELLWVEPAQPQAGEMP